MLSARYHIPLIALESADVDKEAARLIPLDVLERVVAIPYAIEGNTLSVAVADPGDLYGIDALHLATRHALEIGIASRDAIPKSCAV